MEWTGDVDLNDGKLQKQYKAYLERLDFVKQIQVGERSEVKVKLSVVQEELDTDLSFLFEGRS